MITLPQLKMLAKQNKIRVTISCLNKDEIIKQLIDNNIIIPFDLINPKIVVEPVKHNMVKNGYEHLKSRPIRTNPKTVEVFDKETGKTSIFPSTYKARRALGINPVYVKDGTIWKKRYEIKVV